jgi:outer membrane protein
MTLSKFALALIGVSALAFAGQASAQTAKPKAAAPAAAAAPEPNGPPIPGMCVLNTRAVVGGSAVGRFVSQRLEQLQAQAAAEINTEKQTLQADANALESKKATLPPDQYEQQGAAINLRYNALQRKVQQREAEMQQTERKAVGRILQEAEPVERQAFVQHTCTVVLDGSSLIYAAQSLDLTASVIQILDTKITQFQFDREHLDQQAQAQGAGPAH